MTRIQKQAPAKINLTLDVLNRRLDGYHNLSTIMHEIPLCDDIDIYIGGDVEGIRATTNLSYIRGDSNLASKACELFFNELIQMDYISEKQPGVLIDINKRIPVGAGLGGGSADAAAVLKALNEYYDFPFTTKKLMEIGAQVGADVPFCINGGCALCEGIGDIITPQNPLPPCYIVIVKPRASISTAEIFSEYISDKKTIRPDTTGAITSLNQSDLGGISRRVFNVLQEYAEKRIRDIPDIHRDIMRQGALGAAMSGSGSAVFGLFEDREAADACVAYFEVSYSQVFLIKM